MTDVIPREAETLPALTSPTLLPLLEQAVAKGAEGVEALERLAGLMERLEDRQAVKAFHDALKAFQRECPTIPHNRSTEEVGREGSKFDFTWADLPQIERYVADPLDRHGFSYSWDSEVHDGLMITTCHLYHEQGHTRSAKHTGPIEGRRGMDPQHVYATALGYGRRHSLSQVLGISTVDEAKSAPPEPIDEGQVVILEELWELLMAGVPKDKRPSQRSRFFTALAVRPRDDGEFYFGDIPAAGFEAAKKFIENRLAES